MSEIINSMIQANQGFHDGVASAKTANPIHNQWPEGPHFNEDYERGYWIGFNGGTLPHDEKAFEMAERFEAA